MEKYYRFWLSKRFLVCILAFFGEMNIFTSRANMNMAILDMTGNRTIVVNNETVTQPPEFNWDSTTEGFVLGVSNYGILLAPLGGYLAVRFGGSIVVTISALIISILTILTPLAIRFNFFLFIVIRIVEGITESFRYCSFLDLWTYWSPLRERSKLVAITLSGMYAGPAITYPIFGYIIRKYRWPAAFYFTGIFSLLWTCIWFPLVPNSPELDKWISKKELDYIQQDPPQSKPKNLKAVWKNIILSKHTYALAMTKFIFNLGVTVTITCLPMYIKGSSIDEIGIYSAIPNFINIFTPLWVGYMVDHFRNTSRLTTTQAHKLFTCNAFGFGGILLLVMTKLPNNFIIIITCLTVYKLTVCVTLVMADLNTVALAPKCSSCLASYTSLFYMLGSISGPLIIAFSGADHSMTQWNNSFIIFAIISFVGAVFFFLFGSGEPQPWSYSIEEQDKNNDQCKSHDAETTSSM